MKDRLIIALLFLILNACTKKDFKQEPGLPGQHPSDLMITDLNDIEVKQQQHQSLDLDKDGVTDVLFATWEIGDPIEKEDEILFFAASGTKSSLMIGEDNFSPKFNQDELIPVKAPRGYEWYIVAQVELAMKNISDTKPPYWEKEWKDASHKFLAIQVNRSGRLYQGWIELSMDTVQSKLILHRAAIAKQSERAVRAGN